MNTTEKYIITTVPHKQGEPARYWNAKDNGWWLEGTIYSTIEEAAEILHGPVMTSYSENREDVTYTLPFILIKCVPVSDDANACRCIRCGELIGQEPTGTICTKCELEVMMHRLIEIQKEARAAQQVMIDEERVGKSEQEFVILHDVYDFAGLAAGRVLNLISSLDRLNAQRDLQSNVDYIDGLEG